MDELQEAEMIEKMYSLKFLNDKLHKDINVKSYMCQKYFEETEKIKKELEESIEREKINMEMFYAINNKFREHIELFGEKGSSEHYYQSRLSELQKEHNECNKKERYVWSLLAELQLKYDDLINNKRVN